MVGLACIALIFAIAVVQTRNKVENSPVILIIAPHFDDAVLPLGGLLAKEKGQKVIASFFTRAPQVATSTSWDKAAGFADSSTVYDIRVKENQAAMDVYKGITIRNFDYIDSQYGRSEDELAIQTEISKDIQTLLVSIGTKNIKVYGPAYFTDTINHADHALVHKAFIDVARSFPHDNLEFFVYEDYPYIERFNREVVWSLEKNLEDETQLVVEKVEIPLTRTQVDQKIEALKKYNTQIKSFQSVQLDIINTAKNYTEKRCGPTEKPITCEVVYKVFKY